MIENASKNQEQSEVLPKPVVADQRAVQPLTLHVQHRLNGGAFADVFRHPENGRVYKLFRQRKENALLGDDHGENEPGLRRAAFQAERDAYTIAMRVDAIRPYVPTFHGATEVGQVLDAAGVDIADRYLLDCCYIIDFVEGEVVDLTQNLANQLAHLKSVTEAFAANGINHWRDGAVFHPSDPSRTKIIDFATKDAYYEGEIALIMAE